jgi:hypothetical protein
MCVHFFGNFRESPSSQWNLRLLEMFLNGQTHLTIAQSEGVQEGLIRFHIPQRCSTFRCSSESLICKIDRHNISIFFSYHYADELSCCNALNLFLQFLSDLMCV